MRAWNDLGVVETIYEEEHEDASNSPSFTPSTASPSSSSPSSSSLQSKVEEWSRVTGCKVDVSVHVHDHCFHLHKERLALRSGYLRRHVEESSTVTISPPLSISAETFTVVADFCYGADIALTPFNVVSLRVAAELLEMRDDEGDGGWNLYAAIVLPICLDLLPTTEQMVSMASRCVETLATADGTDGRGWLDDVASLPIRDFQMVADSLRERSTHNHDLLYRIVDFYLENHPGKLTEEEKARICYSVDSKRLSPNELVRLMQNPRMPLRFITGGTTLGSILQRDAALRQEAHLRATMEATGIRIQTLERELADIKSRLRMSQERSPQEQDSQPERVRSASCRFFGPEETADVEGWAAPAMKPSLGISNQRKSLGRTLLRGLRNAFRRTKSGSESINTSGCGADGGEDRDVPYSVKQEDLRRPDHRRHHSFA
ncbi:unnamed protein product [Spirodela intermedia]|uniref:Uncharacterized protein n=1 Tax=Spirodela intermedia TaxID=51605 RepID=A0A7I8IK59_SPIIN|nr:unnamed protein product [Spirodela intermedia]CAA6657528.1 unnamed protein product [Spirodela intermedia]